MEVKNDREESAGLYHNDYSPRYRSSYNIYDKARNHMRQIKKEYLTPSTHVVLMEVNQKLAFSNLKTWTASPSATPEELDEEEITNSGEIL